MKGMPRRLIVHLIGTPLQQFVRFQSKTLQPDPEGKETYLNNASHLFQFLNKEEIQAANLIVNIDVVLLFTYATLGETSRTSTNIQDTL